MRAQRHLVLRKEFLAELRANELATLGGGNLEPVLSRGVCVAQPSGDLACETVFRPCSAGCPPLPY